MRSLCLLVTIAIACDGRSAYDRELDAFLTKPADHIRGLMMSRGLDPGILEITYGLGATPPRPRDAELLAKLFALIESSDHALATDAIHFLALMRPAGHHEPLLRCARSNPYFRDRCLDAILTVADPEALSRLSDSLRSITRAQAASFRSEAGRFAAGLGELGLAGLPFLAKAITTGNPNDCRNAVWAIDWTILQPEKRSHLLAKPVSSAPQLRDEALRVTELATRHPGWECRRRAVMTLGRFDEYRTRVEQLRDDRVLFVADAARAILERREPDHLTWEHLDEARRSLLEATYSGGVRERCWVSVDAKQLRMHLETLDARSTLWPTMIGALQHSVASCRQRSAIILGLVDVRTHDELERLRADDSVTVRDTVIAILESGDLAAVRAAARIE